MEELVFQYIEVRTDGASPIKALRQERDGVFVLVRNSQNQWVLGRKKVYPDGVSRLVGGKMEDGENPIESAQRELLEETGGQVDEDRLVPLVHAEVFGQHEGTQVSISVFVFYASVNAPLQADSDVDELVYLTDIEVREFLHKLGDLSSEDIIKDDAPTSWADWGRVWAPIHSAAFERVKELGL